MVYAKQNMFHLDNTTTFRDELVTTSFHGFLLKNIKYTILVI